MAITEKTRKILWARSGNRCAMCKKELVMEKTMLDSESIIGDECHIISEKPKGPRANFNLEIDYDTYSNLILLCKVHDKIIDDQPNEFSAEYLHKLKSDMNLGLRKH